MKRLMHVWVVRRACARACAHARKCVQCCGAFQPCSGPRCRAGRSRSAKQVRQTHKEARNARAFRAGCSPRTARCDGAELRLPRAACGSRATLQGIANKVLWCVSASVGAAAKPQHTARKQQERTSNGRPRTIRRASAGPPPRTFFMQKLLQGYRLALQASPNPKELARAMLATPHTPRLLTKA